MATMPNHGGVAWMNPEEIGAGADPENDVELDIEVDIDLDILSIGSTTGLAPQPTGSGLPQPTGPAGQPGPWRNPPGEMPRIHVYSATDQPVDLNRPPIPDYPNQHGPAWGGVFVTTNNITNVPALVKHVGVVPPPPGDSDSRIFGKFPKYLTEISLPVTSYRPDPGDPLLTSKFPEYGWIPPAAPGTQVEGVWTVSGGENYTLQIDKVWP